MARKTTRIKTLTDLKKYSNNMAFTLKVKEDLHVFEEKPRVPDGQEDGRKNAHELFSLFTANIIKEETTFIR